MHVHKKLQYLRIHNGLSLQGLAEKIGTTKSQIDKLEKGDRRLTVDWLFRLAEALNVNPADLLQETDGASSTLLGYNDPLPPPLEGVAETRALGQRGLSQAYPQLPIYGQRNGLADHLSNFNKPTGFTPAPPFLAGATNAFALYMIDDSMQPRYYPGDLLFVNPDKPVTAGCTVLIIRKDDTGLIRQFVGRKQNAIIFQQFSTMEERSLSITELKNVFRVVGSYEG